MNTTGNGAGNTTSGNGHGSPFDPALGSALATLPNKAAKIKHVCEYLERPSTSEVLATLVTHQVVTKPQQERPYVSKQVNSWRRKQGLSDTGNLAAMSEDVLARMDAERTRTQDTSPRTQDAVDAVDTAEDTAEDTVYTEPAVHSAVSSVSTVASTGADAPVSRPTVTAQAELNDRGNKLVNGVGGRRSTRPRGWFVAWLAFLFGGVVSVAANVAHTLYPTASQLEVWVKAGHPADTWSPPVGAMAFSAFWPIALILSVEVLTRAQWQRGFLYGLARYGGTTLVAAVAAVMSYRHMSGLLAIWGEDAFGAHLGPLAVDGLMVVAAAALLSMSRATKERTASALA